MLACGFRITLRVKTIFALLSMVVLISGSLKANQNPWAVVALREEFGMFDLLRIDSSGREVSVNLSTVELVKGRLVNRVEFRGDAQGEGSNMKIDSMSHLIDEISEEIDSLRARGWKPKEGDSSSSIGALDADGTPIPMDGPMWDCMLIEFTDKGATVRGGFGLINYVSLVLNEVQKQGQSLSKTSGVVIRGPQFTEFFESLGPEQSLVISNPATVKLLKKVGTFVPKPYPKEFQKIFENPNPIFRTSMSGFNFVFWKVQPAGITDQEAENIARKACEGIASLPDDVKVEIARRDDSITVTFPITPIPNTLHGDYHAQITLDAKSGEVLFFLGSQ